MATLHGDADRIDMGRRALPPSAQPVKLSTVMRRRVKESVWLSLAKVVDHDIKCGEEGVHIDHESVPFPSGSGSRPTLERGCLPLKFRADNSHQAFKKTFRSQCSLDRHGLRTCRHRSWANLRHPDSPRRALFTSPRVPDDLRSTCVKAESEGLRR